MTEQLSEILINQDDMISTVVPYIIMYQAGFANVNKPIGTFFLLGPTGVGKTFSIEALAEVLHGDRKKVLRVDCGQYGQSHEVAKLIGAPPGYLGHRETIPILTQNKIVGLRSPNCDISLILFDEIEKAHDSFFRMMLSVMDQGQLSVGDNSVTDFTKSMIFYTSNLGAGEMMQLSENFEVGFGPKTKLEGNVLRTRLEGIGKKAIKKKFQPEFINRLDETVTFKSLSEEAIKRIYNIEVDKVRDLMYAKSSLKDAYLIVSGEAEKYFVEQGFSQSYGARELNRVMKKQLVQPLAELVSSGKIDNRSVVRVDLVEGKLVFNIFDKDILEKSLSHG